MGLFDKLKDGLKKTRESLNEKFDSIIHSFTKIDEEFFEELEETLILSDFGVDTAAYLTEQLRKKVKQTGDTDPSKVKELLAGIVAELLTDKDGGNTLKLSDKPSVILVIGVNGAGKTTSVGKLAFLLKEQGKKVIVAAADTFRAAAIEQLAVWTERAGAELIRQKQGSDPAAVVFDACAAAKARGADVLIIDTAGRLHNKKNLMDELQKIARVVKNAFPDTDIEILLVLDATTGQNAVSQARLFGESANISGIALTKLDGTAKGGIIVSIRNELGYFVKLAGTGETIGDLRPFAPEEYAKALFLNENAE
ncbi:MAG: signal recognition particle-docking protein FtsY [Oscillospiraceae bacterium]|jgi:fused signal recognition particle receptor|nr:signal recognition particle-docking protein FtsY [Oscillospiraceae bacterium]